MIVVTPSHDGAPTPLPTWFHDPGQVDDHVLRREWLAAQQASELVGSGEDAAFDHITQLVRGVLQVPASFVVLLAPTGCQIRSQSDDRGQNQGERVLRGRSFCHYVAIAEQPLVIEDALAHQPWRDVPMVTELQVRAYIGMPLFHQGEVVGTLCAVDHVPRSWRTLDRQVMSQLALSLQRELQLRHDERRARLAARARELQLLGARAAMRDPLQALAMCALQLQRLAGAPVSSGSGVHQRVAAALDCLRQVADGLLSDPLHGAGETAAQGGASVQVSEALTASIDIIGGLAPQAPLRLRRAPALGEGLAAQACAGLHYAELLRLLCHAQASLLDAQPAETVLRIDGEVGPGGEVTLQWTPQALDTAAPVRTAAARNDGTLAAHAAALGARWQATDDGGGRLSLPAATASRH